MKRLTDTYTDVTANDYMCLSTLRNVKYSLIYIFGYTCIRVKYFHPLVFEELAANKGQIEVDILAVFNSAHVTAAVNALG